MARCIDRGLTRTNAGYRMATAAARDVGQFVGAGDVSENWERLVEALADDDAAVTASRLADRLGVSDRTIRSYAAQANRTGEVVVESGLECHRSVRHTGAVVRNRRALLFETIVHHVKLRSVRFRNSRLNSSISPRARRSRCEKRL